MIYYSNKEAGKVIVPPDSGVNSIEKIAVSASAEESQDGYFLIFGIKNIKEDVL